MVIYVEQSLLENFIVDFLLLKLSLLIFKYSTKKYKIYLASFLGAVVSLIAPIVSGIFSFLLKIILSFLMVLIISPKLPPKKILYLYFSFLGSTFLFGGVSFSLLNIVKSFTNNNTTSFPFFYVLLSCISTFYISVILIRKIYERKTTTCFEYTVILTSEHNKITTTAFLDSGNRLTDNGQAVILIDSLTFLKLYPNESLTNVLLKKTKDLSMKNTHILNIQNINNSKSNLIVFSLPFIEIKNAHNALKFKNIPCAITLKKFNLETQASCLLNPLLF